MHKSRAQADERKISPHGEYGLRVNLTERSKQAMIPLGLSLLCFLYYVAFLLQFGEMFYKGSDVVANTAYGMTMFSEVHRAGWTVPKLTHMVLFGSVYWITGDLWFVHLVLIMATALTVWAGCRLIQKVDKNPLAVLRRVIAVPRSAVVFDHQLAGAAMSFSSVSVVGNALRLKRARL